MSIFYEPETVPEEFLDGGIVEIPHSVLLSSLDAETIAQTYGVLASDVLIARQELFAQTQQQGPQRYPIDPGYGVPAGYWTRPPARPRPRPRPSRPPARRPGRIVVRPREGRVRDYRTNRRPRTPPARGPFPRPPRR